MGFGTADPGLGLTRIFVPRVGPPLGGPGRADPQSELAAKVKPGTHALKVSLKGKKDFEQSVDPAGAQATRIEARRVDAPGSIRRVLRGMSWINDPGYGRLSIRAGGKNYYRFSGFRCGGEVSNPRYFFPFP